MLAALKVPSDVRARLLSHGLGGVQNRHYDRHDYAAEKKAALARALVRWVRHLTKLKSEKNVRAVGIRESNREMAQSER